jgi:hypothetical protein
VYIVDYLRYHWLYIKPHGNLSHKPILQTHLILNMMKRITYLPLVLFAMLMGACTPPNQMDQKTRKPST